MKIVIIGNGISGITAARHIRKHSKHDITIISKETQYFYSRTALMYIYMGQMTFEHTKPYEDFFWKKNRIQLLQATAEHINFSKQEVFLHTKESIPYDRLILATGSQYNMIPCKGNQLEGVRGLYSIQDLAYIEKHTSNIQKAVIVGGGLIGIEMAEMFRSKGIEVTFLVREKSYWNKVLPPEESKMINRHIQDHHVDLRLNTELQQIEDDGKGRVAAIITQDGERIPCDFVGMTIGVRPNISFLSSSNLLTNKGIIVNDFLETNIKNVYAIGDCAELATPQKGRRSIEAIWYTGKMMGECVAQTICHSPTPYRPQLWFNSAKFFDIEYQVYGTVLVPAPEHHHSLYWEHPLGQKSIRIIYDANSKKVLGFNLMGIRYRQEVCSQWIQKQASIEEVIHHLHRANFDPEFFKKYEPELVKLYQKKLKQV